MSNRGHTTYAICWLEKLGNRDHTACADILLYMAENPMYWLERSMF